MPASQANTQYPLSSWTPTSSVSALGPAGCHSWVQHPWALGTRPHGFSGVGVIHAPACNSLCGCWRNSVSSQDRAKPARKKACVTKLVPAPAPGCGADPGTAVGVGGRERAFEQSGFVCPQHPVPCSCQFHFSSSLPGRWAGSCINSFPLSI